MAMSGSEELKLISESFIRPKHEQQQQHYLGPIDLLKLSSDQIQNGLLFHSKPKLVSSFLENLNLSLSLSLLHFYPLAGQLATQKFPDQHACFIYVDCSKGPGARFLHASVDLTVSDILSSTDVHPIVKSFFDLGEKSVNHDGHTRPLLSVQVTELLDGIFIGFTMNHSVADGASLSHFISSLSQVFLQLERGKNEESISLSKKPIYGYGALFPDPILKLPYLEPEEFISPHEPGPLRERIFHFSSSAIGKLKAQCQSESESEKISSFQSLCALLWRCVTKARNLEPNEETSFTIAVNARPRIDPPLPEAQFGNIISGAREACEVSELLGRKLGWAAMLLHKSIVAQDDKQVRLFTNCIAKAPFVHKANAAYKGNSLLIGGSARFDMYGPEFGLGKAVAILTGYATKEDGKVRINPGREDDGSVDLEVCLKPHVMDALELDHEFMSYVSST